MKPPRSRRSGFQSRALASRVKSSFATISGLTDLVKIAPLLLFGLIAIALIAVVAVAIFEKLVHPTAQVIVRPFQISTDLSKQLLVSGDAISEMVSDDATTITVEGAQFHGFNPGSSGKHFGRLPLTVQIPVETSIPISLKGIPLDELVKVYDWFRYDQITISGDLYFDSGAIQLRMRAEGGRLDGMPVVTTLASSQSLADALRRSTIRVMMRINPTLVGRMYLFEQDTPGAVQTFREWANSDPLNPEPSFFLAYTYDIDNDSVHKLKLSSDEALLSSRLLADWSMKVASHRNVCRGVIGGTRCMLLNLRYSFTRKSPTSADLAAASLAAVSEDNGDYKKAATEYGRIRDRYPDDINLQINLAKAELDQLPDKTEAITDDQRRALLTPALEGFQAAEMLAPDNPLVEQNIGAALSRQGRLQEAVEYEENAIRLAPGYFQPFQNAVYMLWNGKRYSDAADLCRTVYLLDQRRSPDTSADTGTLPEERNAKILCAYSIAVSGSVQKSLDLLAELGESTDVADAGLRGWAAQQTPALSVQLIAHLDRLKTKPNPK